MRLSALVTSSVLAASALGQVHLQFGHRARSAISRRSPPVGFRPVSGIFVANASIGTPPQELPLFLSTGTVDTWVPHQLLCKDIHKQPDCERTSFSPNASTTFQRGREFGFSSFQQQNGLLALGGQFVDSVKVGDIEIQNVTLGLDINGDGEMGSLGLGPNRTGNAAPSLLDHMVMQHRINSSAYSLWLDNPDADYPAGNLLLGAVDLSKFKGPMDRVTGIKYPSFPQYIGVNIRKFNFTQSPGSQTEVIAQDFFDVLPTVAVNPTEPITNIPRSIADLIWQRAGATYNSSLDLALIPCAERDNTNATLTVELLGGFSGILTVPMRDLIIPAETLTGSLWNMESVGNNLGGLCLFGVQSVDIRKLYIASIDHHWTLGGAMMRRSYLVFDMVNHVVAFAPLRTAADPSSTLGVLPFPSFGARVPSELDIRVWSPSHGMSREALIGTVVGSVVGGLVAIGLVAWLCLRLRRKHKDDFVDNAIMDREIPEKRTRRMPMMRRM